jgi:hypothetical protein
LGGVVDGLANGTSRGVSMERLCSELGWEIDERRGKSLFLDFKIHGLTRRVVISHGGDEPIAIIAVVSSASASLAQVSARVPWHLLNENHEHAIGAWETYVEDGEVTFILSYTALVNGLDAGTLKTICQMLLERVVEFDR